jgi:metal-responsive CopG/Arc/MetJ family transcriptional regulator
MKRFSVTLSDELNEAIDATVSETESSKNEILRKALQLYLAAYEGKKNKDLKLGLIESDKSDALQTEFVGL